MYLINTKMSDKQDETYINLHQARNVNLTMVPQYSEDNERPTPLTIPYTASASGRQRKRHTGSLSRGSLLMRFLDHGIILPDYCASNARAGDLSEVEG